MATVKPFLFVALVAAAGSASAQTVRLKFAPQLGHTYAYRMTTQMGPKQAMAIGFSMRAASFKNGRYTMVTKVDNVSMPGQKITPAMMQRMKSTTTTEVIDASGKVVSVSGGAGAMFGNSFAIYPNHPLRVGETWTSTTSMQSMKMQSTNRLVKLQRIQGVQAALIDVTSTMSGTQKMPASPVAHLWIEVATGLPLRFEMSTNAMGAALKMTLNRI